MPNLYASQYANEKWTMEPGAIVAFLRRLESLRESDTIVQMSVTKNTSLQVVGDTAIIPISGVLLKTVPGWVRWWGIEATGYDEIRQQIEQAMAKRDVKRIHLQIASPGGQVAGVEETGDMIREAGKTKNVTATIEDLGASAAYWLASQANTIEANRTAEVGSIGVYTTCIDMSGYAEGMGMKVIVIRSGEHKGMGVAGAPITDDQIEAVQEVIDGLADQFIATVAAGRNMATADVRKLATGQLWLATAARENGLIDAVVGNTNQISETSSEADAESPEAQGEPEMPNAQTTETPVIKNAVDQAAVTEQTQQAERQRMTALKSEFPDDLAFALDQFEAGATVEQAKAAYCDVLRDRQKDNDKQTAAAGADPLEHNDSAADHGDHGDFMSESRQRSREQKISMTESMRQVSQEKPELYAAFQAAQEKRRPTIRGGKSRRV